MTGFEKLAVLGTPTVFKKGDALFRQGEPCEQLFVIKKGLLKGVYLTHEGKEFIKSFFVEGDLVSSISAVVGKEGCAFSLICLEDVEALSIPYAQVDELAQTDPEITALMIEKLMALSMKKERREYEFLCLKPDERYELFRTRNPELLNRVTQNDIARYLGITPVALSRIRGRLS